MTMTSEGQIIEPDLGVDRRWTRMGRPGRAAGFLAAALVLAAGSYVLPILRPAQTPVSRALVGVAADVGSLTNPDQAGGPAVDDRSPIAERLGFWAGRVQERPDDFLSLVQLASVEAEQARLTVDLDGYERALSDVERSLSVVSAYPPTLRLRASLRFTLHDFDGALADAKTVLKALPDDATALSLVGDASIELGRPADAFVAYERLAGTSRGPWVDIRRARLAFVTGDPASALDLARKAALDARVSDPVELGFYEFALGEYARLTGDAATARTGYSAALRIRPTDLGALVGLARVDAATGRPADAVAGLQKAADIAPQPETLALLGDLLEAGGDRAGAEVRFKTVRFIRQLGATQGAVYDRQLLRFELDHGGATPAVLADVQASVALRPDSTGHDLGAWALYRLGRYDDAAVEIRAARAYGSDDARLRYHDGAIAIARGDRAGGQALLRSALADGPALDPIERTEVERLLGE